VLARFLIQKFGKLFGEFRENLLTPYWICQRQKKKKNVLYWPDEIELIFIKTHFQTPLQIIRKIVIEIV
jgi:hypothetical protein